MIFPFNDVYRGIHSNSRRDFLNGYIEYDSHGISVKLLNVSVTFWYRLGILWIIYVTLEIPSDNKKIALVQRAKNILNKRIRFIFETETARKSLSNIRRKVYLIYLARVRLMTTNIILYCLYTREKFLCVLVYFIKFKFTKPLSYGISLLNIIWK